MASLLPVRFHALAPSAHLRLFPRAPSCARTAPGATFGGRRLPSMSTSPSAGALAEPSVDATASPATAPSDGRERDVVVQYVVLRRDLIDAWPLGSVVTQGCHASVAAVWAHRHHPDVAAYCSDLNIDFMHKVTLEVKGETQLRNLSDKLAAAGIDYKLWIEQPENIPTCLATRPCPKSQVASFFKKLKLCK